MLVFPVVTLLGSVSFGLSPEMTVIAVIFAACPTSTAAFPLAKQMGGDAPLMATIISIQTALAVIAIPIAILLAQAVNMTKPLNGGARCGGLLAFDAAVAPTGIQLMSKTAR